MARFVAVRVLTDHSCAEKWELVIFGRMIGKHTIQLFRKPVFASYEIDQSVNIMLYRPEILPSVAFANMRSIVVCFEIFDKDAFVITRLHE